MMSKVLFMAASCAALQISQTQSLKLAQAGAPKLAALHDRAANDSQALADELASSPIAQIAPLLEVVSSKTRSSAVASAPIVVTHGMGDSCFNPGMQSVTKAAGDHAGQYSVCVPGGPNDVEDTLSGFLVNMDKNVDIFAAKVHADPKLAKGFNAIGLSQGNSVIRGYIERYNSPPVLNYLGVHGTVMGVSGFPNCNPAGIISPICDVLDEVLGDLAYAEVIQKHLFQANYFRDPKRMNSTSYLKNSQIAGWNNEDPARANATHTKNIASVRSMGMVKAMKDTMVYPNAGEWWGEFKPGQFKETLAMKDTPLYHKFGLDTLDAAGKIHFDTTDGEHLRFTVEQLTGWMDKYWV